MSSTLSATLIADGSSDHGVLVPLITLLLDEISPHPFRIASASAMAGGLSLDVRVPQAVALHPCTLLLVHRDSEAPSADAREREIHEAVAAARLGIPHVCIVPIRMTEAWLLVDEAAIRSAAGNPGGRAPLALPPPHQVESVVAAKSVLFRALEVASELGPRRLRAFRPEQHRHKVAEAMESLAPLRGVPSFRTFEARLHAFFDHP